MNGLFCSTAARKKRLLVLAVAAVDPCCTSLGSGLLERAEKANTSDEAFKDSELGL